MNDRELEEFMEQAIENEIRVREHKRVLKSGKITTVHEHKRKGDKREEERSESRIAVTTPPEARLGYTARIYKIFNKIRI